MPSANGKPDPRRGNIVDFSKTCLSKIDAKFFLNAIMKAKCPKGGKLEVRVPRCTPGGDSTATVDRFWVDDGSTLAAEQTTVQLCWTPKHLHIKTIAVDSEVISNKPNCGDRTWQGDSLEVFLSPVVNHHAKALKDTTPHAWLEADVSAAGGMFFAGIRGGANVPKHRKGKCVMKGLHYTAQRTKSGWRDELDIPWSAFFTNVATWKAELDSWGGQLPREWRINFYRTNFFRYCAHRKCR